MKRSRKSTQRFFPDATLFVSAIKNPEKKPGSLDLLLELINSDDVSLIGNIYLIKEIEKYQKRFDSETARELLKELKQKIEVKDIAPKTARVCRPYFPDSERVDVMHAATCLKEGAVIITNDRDFDRIHEEGIIEVWSITRAMKELVE